MRRHIVRAIVAIVALPSAAGNAAAAICLPCPACAPPQMLQVAVDQGQGAWLVWDPTNGGIREYRVTCNVERAGDASIAAGNGHGKRNRVEPNGETTQCTGVEGAVPHIMHDVAAALLRLSNATGGTYRTTAEVRANRWSIRTQPNPSARDYLADFNYRAQVHDRIEQEGLAAVPGVAGEVMPYLMENDVVTRAFTDQVEAVVTVAFDDGSKIDVRLVAGQQPMYVKGSARGAMGDRLDDGVRANASQVR